MIKQMIRIMFLFGLFSLLVFQINENLAPNFYYVHQSNKYFWSKYLLNFDETEGKILPEFKDFIYTNVMIGQLGNQLYRFASLYAIGKLLKRTPVYMHNENGLQNMEGELAKIFPNFYKRIYYLRDGVIRTESFQLIRDNVNPDIILQSDHSTAKGLKLSGDPTLFNYKFFNHIRDEILQIFKFSDSLVWNITKFWNNNKNEMNDTSHKLCIHIRAGDFIGVGESKKEQVVSAVDNIIKRLSTNISVTSSNERNESNFSLLLFANQDQNNFVDQLNFKNKSFNNIYRISDFNMTRGEEMCLASQICDSFLITAPLSTFGFWMAYLLPEGRRVFAIRKYINMGPFPFDTINILPPNWFTIEENDLLLFYN